jgi:outer membrane protein assembly factor BamB
MYPFVKSEKNLMTWLLIIWLVMFLTSCDLSNPSNPSKVIRPINAIVITPSNAPQLMKIWSFGTNKKSVNLLSTFTNNEIYVTSTDNIDSKNDAIYAIDVKTGSKIWSYTPGIDLSTRPEVANGIVYVAGITGTLYALDSKTGSKLWSYTNSAQIANVSLDNDVLYIRIDKISARNDLAIYSDTVFAFNAKTGRPLWSHSIDGQINAFSVSNNIVYFTSTPNDLNAPAMLYAFNGATGTQLWDQPQDYLLEATNGVVYIENSSLYALDGKTGTILWNNANVTNASSVQVLDNGIVYVQDITNSSSWYALNEKTGISLWKHATNLGGSDLTVVKKVAYISDSSTNGRGKINAFDAVSGRSLWGYDTGYFFSDSFAVVNGVLYTANSEDFYAQVATTGAKLWSYFPTDYTDLTESAYSFTLNRGVIYISSQGAIYAFTIPNQRLFPNPTVTSSSATGSFPQGSLALTLNRAPIFADTPGLHIQSLDGLQCPANDMSQPSKSLPPDHLVLATDRLTYTPEEIEQMRNYLLTIANNEDVLATAYQTSPPSTLRWVPGSDTCSISFQISNTGNTTVQIASWGVKLMRTPQKNTYRYRSINLCSLFSLQGNPYDYFCNNGSGGGGCSEYTADIALNADATPGTLFPVVPVPQSGLPFSCYEPILYPNDSIGISMTLSSIDPTTHAVAPYIYAVMPVITITDAQGAHVITLSALAGTATFADTRYMPCYSLSQNQPTTFIRVGMIADSTTSCL